MHRVEVKASEAQLPELIDEAADGAEVVILREDGATFRLVRAVEEAPRPKFGSARGMIEMADDFDEPLEDFRDYEP